MNDQAEKPQVKPPYATYRTLMKFIDGLAGHMPAIIDRSIMGSMSGSSQTATLLSLRYLNLIDAHNRPTELLRRLAGSSGEERKEVLKEILDGAYSLPQEVNLEVATPSQVETWFREQGLKGSTVTRATAFFIAAGEEAGLEISKHVTERVKRTPSANRNAGGSTRATRTRKKRPSRPTPAGEGFQPPRGTTKYDIPLPPKPTASVILPNDLTAEDWTMLQQIIDLYAKRMIAHNATHGDAEEEAAEEVE